MSLSGLAQINVELSSRCNKRNLCAFCGHQNSVINTGLTYGDMDFTILSNIRQALDVGVVVQFHRDGDPLVYPRLRDALDLFTGFTTNLVTHGEILADKAESIIGRCTTVTVSCFKGDPDHAIQFEAVTRFLHIKGSRAPMVLIKIVGDYPDHPYGDLGVQVIHRLIHQPTGNTKYAHRTPTVPEHGICLDALHHPSVDWQGNVYLCNRLDPTGSTKMGDLRTSTLDEIWNGHQRQYWIEAHKAGRRDQAASLCKDCTFWGVPSGYEPSTKAELIQVGA